MNINRFIIFVIGILILALGVAFTILSNSGTSPFDATLVGLSNRIGLTVGSWEIIISSIIIFCNSFLQRKRPEFLGLLTAFFTGFGIDLWLFLLSPIIKPESFLSEMIWLSLGMIGIGLGTAIYLCTKITPSPLDKLMLVICEKFGLSILYSRSIVYAVFLFIAFIAKGPIGIGTILTAILGGPILSFFMIRIEKLAKIKPLSYAK